MTVIIERSLANVGDVIFAYLFAVTSSSLSFMIISSATEMIRSGGFESATTNSIPVKTLHFFIMTLLMFVIEWLFAFVAALIPFIIGIAIARWLKITHWIYFVTGATATAAALNLICISIASDPEPSFIEQFLTSSPLFLTSGSIAGAVCWHHLKTRAKVRFRN